MKEEKNREKEREEKSLSTQGAISLKGLLNEIPIEKRKKWVVVGFVMVALLGIGRTLYIFSQGNNDRVSAKDSIVLENLSRLTAGMSKVDQDFSMAKDSMTQLFEKVDSIHIKKDGHEETKGN